VCRINAASRNEGLTYSSLKNLLTKSSIELNLKMLAQLSVLEKETFSKIVEKVKTS
jgi:large subunit ribosomal protein L20